MELTQSAFSVNVTLLLDWILVSIFIKIFLVHTETTDPIGKPTIELSEPETDHLTGSREGRLIYDKTAVFILIITYLSTLQPTDTCWPTKNKHCPTHRENENAKIAQRRWNGTFRQLLQIPNLIINSSSCFHLNSPISNLHTHWVLAPFPSLYRYFHGLCSPHDCGRSARLFLRRSFTCPCNWSSN